MDAAASWKSNVANAASLQHTAKAIGVEHRGVDVAARHRVADSIELEAIGASVWLRPSLQQRALIHDTVIR